MSKEPKLTTELVDHLLSKVISYATKADMPLGDIVLLDQTLKEGMDLLNSQQRLVLVAKLVTKNIFRSILNYGKNSNKDINDLCHNILLFNGSTPIDAVLVAKLLANLTDGNSTPQQKQTEEVSRIETIPDYKIDPPEPTYNSPSSSQSSQYQSDQYQPDYEQPRYGSLNKEKIKLIQGRSQTTKFNLGNWQRVHRN